MLLREEVRGSAAGKQAAKFDAVAHAARVLLQNFADGGAHGKLPYSGALYFSAGAIELRAAVFALADTAKPGSAILQNVRHVAERFHVIDYRGLAERADHGRKRRLGAWISALA